MDSPFHKVNCPNCGALRDEDFSKPCGLCGSKNIPFFGYSYGIESGYIKKILLVLVAMAFLAFIAGVVFMFVRILLLSS